MTTPYQESPDGAFTIGGGEWNYGQTLTEALGKAAFELPMPTLENALDLLRMVLERLPLEALKPFQGFLDLSDELFGNVTDAVNAIIDSLFEKPVWDALLNTLKLVCEFITNNTLAQCIGDLAEDTGDSMLNFVHGLFGLLGGLWDTVSTNPLVTCIAGMVEDTGNLLQNFVEGLLGLLGGFWQMLQENPLAQCLVDWFEGLFGSAGNFLASFVAAVAYLLSELANFLTENPLINAFKDLVDDTGLLLLNVLNGAAEALQQLFNLVGFANPTELLNFLNSAVSDVWELLTGGIAAGDVKTVQDLIEALTAFIARIPLIGPLVGYLTQGIEGIDFTPDFAGLSQWAERLLHTQSKIPASNLFGQLPPGIIPTIPVANINNTTENLLSQGSFGDASNIDAANGWTWDSAVNRPGSTGGSAKINCATTSGTRQLYSNQNIAVAAGDRIGVSAFVNTSGYNGSSISIQIGIVTFAGKVQKQTELLASRGGSNNAWGELTNRDALWTVPTAANPADQITSVQVTIAVGNTATAGSVYWDDISLWKGGNLRQSLVEYLIGSWNSLIGGLSTNSTGGTPPSANTVDPWNFLLNAGAAARQQANSALTNAATADGKAEGANTRVTDTNQGLFGQDSFTPGTTLNEQVLPPTVGAVGSGVMITKTTSGVFGGVNTGRNPSSMSVYNQIPQDTEDIKALRLSGGGLAGIQVKNSGWYLCEVSYGLNSLTTASGVPVGSATYNYSWNLAPTLYCIPGTVDVNPQPPVTTPGTILKIGSDTMFLCTNNGTGVPFVVYGWSQRYAQSSFIVYLPAGYWVRPGTDWNGPNNVDIFKSDGSGADHYFSISMLNRSLA